MRHTSAITPYRSTVELSLEDLCWSRMQSAIPIFQWVARKTPEVHARLNRERGEDKGTQPRTPMVPRVAAVGLQLRDPDALLHASAKQGYRLVDTCVSGCYAALAAAASWRLLQNATGQRLALAYTGQGRLVLHTAAEQQIHPVMHQHTLDQVRTHFAKRHMQVQMWSLAHGAVQLLAHATGMAEADGVRAVSLHVQADGCVEVEVDGVGALPCDDLVTALAEAMGGIVTTYAGGRPRTMPPFCSWGDNTMSDHGHHYGETSRLSLGGGEPFSCI